MATDEHQKTKIEKALSSAKKLQELLNINNSSIIIPADRKVTNAISVTLAELISLIEDSYNYQNTEHYANIKKTLYELESLISMNYMHTTGNESNKLLTLKNDIHELVGLYVSGGVYDSKNLENIINGKIKQLEKKQSVTMAEIEKAVTDYKKQFNHYEQQINISANKKLAETHDQLTAVQIETMGKISAKELDILNLANKAQQEIHSAISDVNQKINAATAVSANTAKTIFNEIKAECLTDMQKDIKSHIKIFVDEHRKLNRLLEVAGNDILAKDNIKQAEQERKEANYLRNTGFAFLLAAVIYIAVEISLLVHGSSEVTLERVLIRLIVTLVLMIPSAYLLKESARHRSDERTFRKKGIHLATIDSYLANFDDASKLDIKRQLTANFFDNKDTVIDYSTVPDMNSSLVSIIEALVEKVKTEDSAAKFKKPEQEATSPSSTNITNQQLTPHK